jgi:hypothetical protein
MGLAPWCVNEKWEYVTIAPGKFFAVVTGRQRCPLKYRLNPIWWIQNSYEQQLSEAPWYDPGKPQWQRWLGWLVRNPFENANMFVLGCADRNYTVTVIEGAPDPMVVQRDDLQPPQLGWQRALLTMDDGSTRTWRNYAGKRIVWSWGCQPTGLFEIKFNVRKKGGYNPSPV